MSFLESFLRRLRGRLRRRSSGTGETESAPGASPAPLARDAPPPGGDPTPDGSSTGAAAPSSDLRRRVEEALDSDDVAALASLLEPHREEGKRLIREYEREIRRTPEEPVRLRLARRITALVAVFDKAFGDREPLGWFQREGETPRSGLAGIRLREAREAFAAGDLEKADGRAADGLHILENEPDAADSSALRSTLHAVRGGVAARRDRLDEALEAFDLSVHWARAADRREILAAALLNLVDLHTRREAHEEAESLLDEATEAASGTTYENILGKLLVERGVALTRAGRLPEAIATLDRAVALHPTWPFPLYQRGWARFLAGDSGGALEDYRECATRKRIFFTVQREIRCLEDVAAGRLPIDTYRTFCFLRDTVRARPAEAEEAASRMVEQHPDFSPAHLLRAEAHLALRDPAKARAAAREALRHDPDPDTAAAALFFEWNISRLDGDSEAGAVAAERLRTAYRDHPAAMIVERIHETPKHNVALRWTFAMDGTLHFEEVDPSSISPPDRTPPPPGSPG